MEPLDCFDRCSWKSRGRILRKFDSWILSLSPLSVSCFLLAGLLLLSFLFLFTVCLIFLSTPHHLVLLLSPRSHFLPRFALFIHLPNQLIIVECISFFSFG